MSGIAVLDTFTRADGTTNLGIAESGQPWTQNNGPWGISSNQAYTSTATGGSAGAYASVDAGHAVQNVFVTLPIAPGVGEQGGLVARFQDTVNWWSAVIYNNAGTLQFYAGKAVANTVTWSIASALTVGGAAPYLIQLVVTSTDVWTAYLNGTQMGTVTDSAFNTQTGAGLNIYASTAVRLDNFRVVTPLGRYGVSY